MTVLYLRSLALRRAALLAALLLVVLAAVPAALAQSFTLDAAASAVVPNTEHGALAWGDYDNDGDLDLAVIGGGTPGFYGEVYANDGDGGLTLDAASSGAVANVQWGALAWGDYDGDGDLDLVVTGYAYSGAYVGEVYRNEPTGTLALDAPGSAVIPNLVSGSLAWGDYDGDGDLDLVVTGRSGPNHFGEVYANDGAGGLTLDAASSAVVANVHESALAWGDYDGDGDLDLIVTGDTGSSFVGEVYENDGAGGLALHSAASDAIPNVDIGSVAWGDYDGDGDLDLVVTGDATYNVTANYDTGTVYAYDELLGTFAEDAAAGTAIADVYNGSVAWGDYDGDGDLDLVVTGYGPTGRVGEVYRNDGDGGFALDAAASAVVADVYIGSVAWGDYDGDGDLDLVSIGHPSSGLVGEVYRNDRPSVTTGPVDGDGNPLPDPLKVAPEGQTEVLYAGTVGNPGPGSLEIGCWPVITMPDGTRIVRRRASACNVEGGGSRDYDGAFNMLASFEPGTYRFTYTLGVHPDDVWTSDFFELLKEIVIDPTKAPITETERGGSMAARAVADLARLGDSEWVAVAPGEDVAEAFAALDAAPASDDAAALPGRTVLGAAYPNPFNPTATVPFHIAEAGTVRLAVYDVLGREVARLVDGHAEAGSHTAVFDASMLPSGTYLVRFEAAGQAHTQRLTLLK